MSFCALKSPFFRKKVCSSMNENLTLDMLLSLPKEVLKKAEEYDEYTGLLEKRKYQNYDFKKIKIEIKEYFEDFRDAKYSYKFSAELNISITHPLQLREGSFQRTNSDPFSKAIEKHIDEKIWLCNFYNTLLVVGQKLTFQEAIYFVDTFFGNKSEDIISEKLGICRNTLQGIKKSCLVKAYTEIQTLDKKD